jgi:hypothetical protein
MAFQIPLNEKSAAMAHTPKPVEALGWCLLLLTLWDCRRVERSRPARMRTRVDYVTSDREKFFFRLIFSYVVPLLPVPVRAGFNGAFSSTTRRKVYYYEMQFLPKAYGYDMQG